MSDMVHVAVGVAINRNDEVLISLRHPDSHQGGLWEFPGGKVEATETVVDALRREFHEELGIQIQACFPLRKIKYHYSDKSVLLDVWHITAMTGQAEGREGQSILWCPISRLSDYKFPAANTAIIKTVQLPRIIAITPEADSLAELLMLVEQSLCSGYQLLQIRQPALSEEEYQQWFAMAADRVRGSTLGLIANCEPSLSVPGAVGYHLNSQRLMSADRLQANGILGVSCHNLAELDKAQGLNVDYALLSPVAPNDKYSSGKLLGWEGFAALAEKVSLPVYALGGLSPEDTEVAPGYGAWGVAGISQFLKLQPA